MPSAASVATSAAGPHTGGKAKKKQTEAALKSSLASLNDRRKQFLFLFEQNKSLGTLKLFFNNGTAGSL